MNGSNNTQLQSTHVFEDNIIENPDITATYGLAGLVSNVTTSDEKSAETIETGFSEWTLPLKSAKSWGKIIS